jgi:hypothetical protein
VRVPVIGPENRVGGDLDNERGRENRRDGAADEGFAAAGAANPGGATHASRS